MKFHYLPRLLCTGLALMALIAAPLASAADKPLKIGFAQTGAESAWRTANTESMKSEAAKRGIDLKFADGQGVSDNQIRAVRSFVTQGVDVIIIAPIVTTGWEPVLREAKRAKIPVMIMDRSVDVSDESLYACFIGSDFAEEGHMAADWLVKHTNGKGRILELLGSTGSAAANERHRAFAESIAKYPGLQVIDAQSGDFGRELGKQVMEAFLKKHGRDFDIVYAHNDDMALGAIQAIEAAGLKPGKDVMVISIDATRAGIEAVVAGKINCVVECNPLFGPKAYDAAAKLAAGQPVVPRKQLNKDELFDATNAAAALPTRKY